MIQNADQLLGRWREQERRSKRALQTTFQCESRVGAFQQAGTGALYILPYDHVSSKKRSVT